MLRWVLHSLADFCWQSSYRAPISPSKVVPRLASNSKARMDRKFLVISQEQRFFFKTVAEELSMVQMCICGELQTHQSGSELGSEQSER